MYEDKRKNLEPTIEKGIFMGYSETTQEYRVYLLGLEKIVLRRDVRFEEDRALRESLERDKISLPQMEVLLCPKEES